MKKKSLKLGLPYKGSKRKLSAKIVDKILEENPNVEYVYDLFGGGGSISLEFASRDNIKKVFYNEINIAITSLLKEVLEKGVTKEYYQWISREKFFKHKDDKDWFGGFVSVIFSFSNDLKSYIYGKKIEKERELIHRAMVNCDKEAIKQLNLKVNCSEPSIQKRRLQLNSQLTKEKRLRHLESLQQLEKLYLYPFKDKLEFLSKSYNEVDINTPVDKTIIYLDPPYKNTNKYPDIIDYDELYNWIRKSKYKIYISEYNMPKDFKIVEQYSHRAINGLSVNNEVTEKLYSY